MQLLYYTPHREPQNTLNNEYINLVFLLHLNQEIIYDFHLFFSLF